MRGYAENNGYSRSKTEFARNRVTIDGVLGNNEIIYHFEI